jgi:proline dehydrogenase
MREFNSLDVNKGRGQVQPLVYGTFQAYLRRCVFLSTKEERKACLIDNNRTPAHLALSLADARANNYALGVKLVRGAYHPHEIAAHKAAATHDKAAASDNNVIATASPSLSPDDEPPVWMEKRQTDEAYNLCLKVLIKAVKDDVKRCEEAVRDIVVEGNGTEVTTTKKGWFGLFSSGSANIFTGAGTDTKENERATEADKRPKTTARLPPPGIGVLFGTHNWTSCGLVLKNLVNAGLAVANDDQELKPEEASVVKISDEVAERIVIAQHHGAFHSECTPMSSVHLLPFSKVCVMI